MFGTRGLQNWMDDAEDNSIYKVEDTNDPETLGEDKRAVLRRALRQRSRSNR